MNIEVIYASNTTQYRKKIDCPAGFTAKEAIEQSGILSDCSEIDLSAQPVGIFGQKITLSTPLTHGDRIEIYRPLTIDPMQKRRLLAQKKPLNR